MSRQKKTASAGKRQRRKLDRWLIPMILNAVAITVGLVAIGLSLMQLLT